MRLSRYFHALRDGYFSELDDLRQDSEGRDVLKARLRDKRDAFPTLAAMLDIDPLMAAPALHAWVVPVSSKMPLAAVVELWAAPLPTDTAAAPMAGVQLPPPKPPPIQMPPPLVLTEDPLVNAMRPLALASLSAQ